MSLRRLHIPSKTFLLGEYGVLFGGPIVVLTHAPFFQTSLNDKTRSFHVDSPASILMKEFNLVKNFDFEDPHVGGGGFGGSTAEVVASLKNRVNLSAKEVHQRYLSVFSGKTLKPSGADLFAQWNESDEKKKRPKLSLFENAQADLVDWPFKDVSVLIYKRPKKLKTHDHLEDLSKTPIDFKKLISIAKLGVNCLKDKDMNFFNYVDEFSKEQKRLNLIDIEAFEEVEKIKKLSSVVSARACGAMGVDVVAVFCSLKEDLDKIKAKIVGLNLDYKLVTTTGYGDFSSD